MGATKVHGRYSCFCFISTPKHIPIHYHTVDGCEILHQLVDDNPMIYTVSCFIVTNSYAGWWFGFRVAIHSFVMRLWKTTVRANVPSPFVWGLDLKVLLVPDMTLDFRLWHGISKEELAVLSIYWGTLHVFFLKDFDLSRGHSLAGATLWNPGTPCGGVYLQSRHTGAGGDTSACGAVLVKHMQHLNLSLWVDKN